MSQAYSIDFKEKAVNECHFFDKGVSEIARDHSVSTTFNRWIRRPEIDGISG